MMDLMRINSLTGGTHNGGNPIVMGLVNDTRKDCQQKLYVAIEGPNFDGHQYIEDAHAKGAVAALTQKTMNTEVPNVLVDDSILAMGEIAAAWRKDFDMPLLAITGSAGKTTLKELAGSVLSQSRKGIITEGNLNNEIGVPLTLTRINSEHEFAVIEMGMNHAGEIDYLSKMASPTVAIINNAAPAHLDELGSVEAVAKAKGEIINGLSSEGILIVNADDEFCPLWKSLAANKAIVSFGLSEGADISANYEMADSGAIVHVKGKYGEFSAELSIIGEHNIRNALAVIAATIEMGCSIEDVQKGLKQYQPIANRGGSHYFENGLIIDDTYNANPASMQAAFDVLALQSAQANKNHQLVRTTVILGSMAELGQLSVDLHKQVGLSAKSIADDFYCCGQHQQDYCRGYGDKAQGFDDVESLIDGVKATLENNQSKDQFDLILVKGSRSAGMERVVKELRDTFQVGISDDASSNHEQREN